MDDSGKSGSSTGPFHAPMACIHCGTRSSERLFQQQGESHACEGCLLDQHPATLEIDTDGLYARFVEALTETLDIREKETGLHSRRAACHTQVLAKHLIEDSEHLRQVYWGALLHDIGKIGIPDHILLKHSQLDEAEWTVMRTHVDMGYHIVSQLPDLAMAAELVRCHEERYDGSGYPRGLRGEQIPMGARLFAIIDALDAMTSDRSYRKAMPFDAAKNEIISMAGTQFDPVAVEVFLAEEKVLHEMVQMKCSLERPA